MYRIRLSFRGPDPRIALRDRPLTDAEAEEALEALSRLDARSAIGPWTEQTLRVIKGRPAERAADLAGELGVERDRLKGNVRKLKALGLTESLEVGYRLSPRGSAPCGDCSKGSGLSLMKRGTPPGFPRSH